MNIMEIGSFIVAMVADDWLLNGRCWLVDGGRLMERCCENRLYWFAMIDPKVDTNLTGWIIIQENVIILRQDC